MIQACEHLQRLRVALVAGQVPDDLAGWLAAGINAYLDGEPLEVALGLKSRRGKSSVPARLRFETRDEIIKRLARQLEGSPWAVAGQLAAMVAEYGKWRASGINLREAKTRALLPVSIAGWRLGYFEAADSLATDIPTSQNQLHNILNGRRD